MLLNIFYNVLKDLAKTNNLTDSNKIRLSLRPSKPNLPMRVRPELLNCEVIGKKHKKLN